MCLRTRSVSSRVAACVVTHKLALASDNCFVLHKTRQHYCRTCPSGWLVSLQRNYSMCKVLYADYIAVINGACDKTQKAIQTHSVRGS